MVGFLVGLLVTAVVMGAVLLVGGGTFYLLAVVVSGLAVGWARGLALAGTKPPAPGALLLVGAAGAVLGGFVGWFLFVGNPLLGVLSAVAGSASLVWAVSRQVGTRTLGAAPGRGRRRPSARPTPRS